MFEPNTSPPPTSSAPLPPWRSAPKTPLTPAAPEPVVQPPGPWSRPTPQPAHPAAAPVAPLAAPASAQPPAQKEWGPLKPIRTVPKPSDDKVAYVLAQAERVVDTDRESTQRRWVIIGSVTGILVIIGGTLAFVFFGRQTTQKLPANQALILVNTNAAKTINQVVNNLFPGENTNQPANVNTAAPGGADADADGLSDADEVRYGTSSTNPDTDGDGFKDGAEVTNGYNPAGPGRL